MSEQEEQAIERRKKFQREVNAFHRTFSTKDGKLALKLIRAKFKTDKPAFLPVEGRYDPISAAIRDGNREVILFIEAVLSNAVDGDANITTAKPATKRE